MLIIFVFWRESEDKLPTILRVINVDELKSTCVYVSEGFQDPKFYLISLKEYLC